MLMLHLSHAPQQLSEIPFTITNLDIRRKQTKQVVELCGTELQTVSLRSNSVWSIQNNDTWGCLILLALVQPPDQNHETQHLPRGQAGSAWVPRLQANALQSLPESRTGRLGEETDRAGPVCAHHLSRRQTSVFTFDCSGFEVGGGIIHLRQGAASVSLTEDVRAHGLKHSCPVLIAISLLPPSQHYTLRDIL